MWQLAFSSKSVFVEDEARLADARRAVDERDLAEERRLRVARELRADHLGAVALGPHLDDPASLEAELEALDERADPGHDERVRRADDALGPAPVGRREDLLGRDVREVLDPALRLERRAHPARAGEQPDDEIGARPAEADRVEPRSFSASARACSFAACSRQAATGSVLVEPHRRRDGLPEPLDVGLAEHRLGPARRSGAGTITQFTLRPVTSGR